MMHCKDGIAVNQLGALLPCQHLQVLQLPSNKHRIALLERAFLLGNIWLFDRETLFVFEGCCRFEFLR